MKDDRDSNIRRKIEGKKLKFTKHKSHFKLFQCFYFPFPNLLIFYFFTFIHITFLSPILHVMHSLQTIDLFPSQIQKFILEESRLNPIPLIS